MRCTCKFCTGDTVYAVLEDAGVDWRIFKLTIDAVIIDDGDGHIDYLLDDTNIYTSNLIFETFCEARNYVQNQI